VSLKPALPYAYIYWSRKSPHIKARTVGQIHHDVNWQKYRGM